MTIFLSGVILVATLFAQATPQNAWNTSEGAVIMSELDGNWIVTHADGITLRDQPLRFEISGGSVFGQAPCNSFRADLIANDREFSLGPLDLRGNVCGADIMADEQEYIRILSRLSEFKIDADGTLVLGIFGNEMIRAKPEEN